MRTGHLDYRTNSSVISLCENIFFHGISFLPKADIIITLVDGKISEMGSYNDLISHAGAFAEFLKNYLKEELQSNLHS
jgi:ABC-type transport system involved in Fe-S cluster assembly fused permease/ATPase subunit